MKLTSILLLATVMQVSARTDAQTVTYSAKSESLAKVFQEIERQTGFVFFFRNVDVKKAKPITVSLNNIAVREGY